MFQETIIIKLTNMIKVLCNKVRNKNERKNKSNRLKTDETGLLHTKVIFFV